MNQHEEHLQKKIESGEKADASDINSIAYERVFHALRKSPEYTLPSSFADRLVAKIEARKGTSDRKDFFWLGLGIFFLTIGGVIAAAAALSYVTVNANFEFLSGLLQYKGLLITGAILLIIFNRLEKKLMQRTV